MLITIAPSLSRGTNSEPSCVNPSAAASTSTPAVAVSGTREAPAQRVARAAAKRDATGCTRSGLWRRERRAQRGHERERQHERAEQREDHRERHRFEQPALDTFEREDRQVHREDDQLAEERRPAHFDRGLLDHVGHRTAAVVVRHRRTAFSTMITGRPR